MIICLPMLCLLDLLNTIQPVALKSHSRSLNMTQKLKNTQKQGAITIQREQYQRKKTIPVENKKPSSTWIMKSKSAKETTMD